nr:hypothetical protein [Streptomyces chartreusis]
MNEAGRFEANDNDDNDDNKPYDDSSHGDAHKDQEDNDPADSNRAADGMNSSGDGDDKHPRRSRNRTGRPAYPCPGPPSRTPDTRCPTPCRGPRRSSWTTAC